MYFWVLQTITTNIISAEFIQPLYTSLDVNNTSKNFVYNQKSECTLADENCAILGRVFMKFRAFRL